MKIEEKKKYHGTEAYADAKEKILDQIVNPEGHGRFGGLAGPYSHNIIGVVLRDIAEKEGDEVANQMIDDCCLHHLGWNKKTV